MDQHTLYAYYNKIGEAIKTQTNRTFLAQLMQKSNYLMF
jgi:hypothetical protein